MEVLVGFDVSNVLSEYPVVFPVHRASLNAALLDTYSNHKQKINFMIFDKYEAGKWK